MKKIITLLLVLVLSLTGCSGDSSAFKNIGEVETFLNENNYLTGEKSDTMYQLIGAVNGFKYIDSHIEVYEFESASKAKECELKSGINGKYVIYCEKADNKDEIVSAFESK